MIIKIVPDSTMESDRSFVAHSHHTCFLLLLPIDQDAETILIGQLPITHYQSTLTIQKTQ
ncbi:hypothetical protein [Nostoc parmelioides]|uniref:hypothetical protein n=1 Tax=Nostoc parmelioides TaxID=1521621 RepID=UPI001A7E5517|nr:hypothetical protein [Nostoc parmelioides]